MTKVKTKYTLTLNTEWTVKPKVNDKCSVLFRACVCLQEALEELEDLKQIIPTESLVYFLMGKVSPDSRL